MSTAEIKCVFTEIWPLTKFVEHPKNPKKHPDIQVVLLGRVILSQGWRKPIVVSSRSGYVVKGHGRLKAAHAIGLETAPVEIQDYASEKDELADMLADNRLAELSEVDDDQLKALLAEINTEGIGVHTAGFTDRAYAELLGGSAAHTQQARASTKRASARRIGAKILQYNIVFDNELQQHQWFAFLKYLKTRYPDKLTISERIFDCIADSAKA